MRTLLSALFVTLLFNNGLTAVPAADDQEKPAETPNAQADVLKPLNRQQTVLVDLKGKRVLLKTKVVQREALLEFFCCLHRTLEHESILAVDADAKTINAALLAVGAKPGKPVSFDPEFQPPQGQKIDIFVQWRDEKKQPQRVKAQEWVRTSTRRFYSAPMPKLPADLKIPQNSELRYDKFAKELLWFGQMQEEEKKRMLKWSQDKEFQKAISKFFEESQPQPMKAQWVYTGSMLVKDPEDGRVRYLAESGQIVSVANFASSIIDIAMRSTDAEADLLFEAATEKIPPLETEVLLELIPHPEKAEEGKDKPAKTPQNDRE